MSQAVAQTITQLKTMEALVGEYAGIRLERLEMLDVGPGQRLIHMRYFDLRGNMVIGVDRDVIPQGFDIPGYVRMMRSNGLRRAVKTLGRKTLRLDSRFTAELERQLTSRAPSRHRLQVYQADATSLPFNVGTFDFSYSSSVMQYLEHPVAALREMARVVRPGGGAFVDFVPYTGPNGCLDIRTLGGREALPHWAHLRPTMLHLVRENAPLNKLRLPVWRELFADAMPGSTFLLQQPDRDKLKREAVVARRHDGALLDYEIEELVTNSVVVVWRKPA
jgi:SAM-dependent methyltransferase